MTQAKILTFSAIAFLTLFSNSVVPKAKNTSGDKAEVPRKAALKRVQGTAAMLDNIFKQTIVLVTDKKCFVNI